MVWLWGAPRGHARFAPQQPLRCGRGGRAASQRSRGRGEDAGKTIAVLCGSSEAKGTPRCCSRWQTQYCSRSR